MADEMEGRDSILKITSEAQEEIQKAYQWYIDNANERVATDFLTQLEQAIFAICEKPDAGALYRELESFRWKKMKRFPYLAIYQQFGDFILLIALSHERREPGYWKNRSNE